MKARLAQFKPVAFRSGPRSRWLALGGNPPRIWQSMTHQSQEPWLGFGYLKATA